MKAVASHCRRLGYRRFHVMLQRQDDHTRGCLALITDTSLSGRRVARVLYAIPVGDYSDDNDRVCRNFETVLDEIDLACREAGMEPVGATFADVVAMAHDKGQRRRDFVFADSTLLTG